MLLHSKSPIRLWHPAAVSSATRPVAPLAVALRWRPRRLSTTLPPRQPLLQSLLLLLPLLLSLNQEGSSFPEPERTLTPSELNLSRPSRPKLRLSLHLAPAVSSPQLILQQRFPLLHLPLRLPPLLPPLEEAPLPPLLSLGPIFPSAVRPPPRRPPLRCSPPLLRLNPRSLSRFTSPFARERCASLVIFSFLISSRPCAVTCSTSMPP